MLSQQTRFGLFKQFEKSKRIHKKLSPDHVDKSLSGSCCTKRSCLQVFKAQPLAVLRWRQLFFALPKADRVARLVQMFRTGQQKAIADHSGDSSGFQMQFRFFGLRVCREAFIALTAIFADQLQAARTHALSSTTTAPTQFPTVRKRPLAYVDARAWLLDYAKNKADTSPLNDKLYLPCGRKYCYYAMYLQSREKAGVAQAFVASLTVFLQAWRVELPWVVIRPDSGAFTRCGLCDFLKAFIDSCQDAVLRQSIIMRLGQHYEFQGAQRLAKTIYQKIPSYFDSAIRVGPIAHTGQVGAQPKNLKSTRIIFDHTENM